MSENSGAFLTKSIILLAVFLVCIGTSMWLGKELGRRIMDTTRSNIEEKYPDSVTADNGDEYVLDMVGGRSSFGYDSGEFGENRFQAEWADPASEELASGEEAPTVTVTPLDPDEVTGDTEGGDGETAGSADSGDGSDSGDSVFDLGDSTTYRIQVGTYAEKDNAEGVWKDLTQAGYNSSISTFRDENDATKYRVTVGIYHTLEEANRVADELRSMGFSGWVQEIKTE